MCKSFAKVKVFIIIVVVLSFLSPLFSQEVQAFDNSWEDESFPIIQKDTYMIIYDGAPVRHSPYKSDPIVNRLDYGQYVTAYKEENIYGNTWLHYIVDGEDFYIYSECAEIHNSHCWAGAIQTDVCSVAVCDCGYISINYINSPEYNSSFDFIEWFLQLIGGNYIDTTYPTVEIVSAILGYVPVTNELMSIRDISADIYYNDKTSLFFDVASLVPIVDKLFDKNDARLINTTLDTTNLFCSITEVLSANNINCFDVQDVLEYRFYNHFNISQDDLLTGILNDIYKCSINIRMNSGLSTAEYWKDFSYDEICNSIEVLYSYDESQKERLLQSIEKIWID